MLGGLGGGQPRPIEGMAGRAMGLLGRPQRCLRALPRGFHARQPPVNLGMVRFGRTHLRLQGGRLGLGRAPFPLPQQHTLAPGLARTAAAQPARPQPPALGGNHRFIRGKLRHLRPCRSEIRRQMHPVEPRGQGARAPYLRPQPIPGASPGGLSGIHPGQGRTGGVGIGRQLGQGVGQGQRAQPLPQHGLHRPFPARRHVHLFDERPGVRRCGLPARRRRAGAPTQAFQGAHLALQPLPGAALRIQRPPRHLLRLPLCGAGGRRCLQGVARGALLGSGLFLCPLGLSHSRVQRLRVGQGLRLQARQASGGIRQPMGQLFAPRLGAGLLAAQAFPGGPGLFQRRGCLDQHGILFLQGRAGGFAQALLPRERRGELGRLGLCPLFQRLGGFPFLGQGQQARLELIPLGGLAYRSLLQMAALLLQAGELAAGGEVALLQGLEGLGASAALFGTTGLFGLTLGQRRLQVATRRLLPRQRLLQTRQLLLALAPAPRRELDLQRLLALAQGEKLARALGLTGENLQLAPHFLAQVGEARQVVAGLADAGFGFATPLAVARHAGRLLHQGAQFLGPRLDQAADHALFDDGVAAWSKAGAEEQVGDIAPAAARGVEEILGLAIAGEHPAHHDFAIAPPRPFQAPGAVVEMQFDAGLGDGRALAGAVEDDVGQGIAAQVAGGALAHHPAHRVDEIGFSAAIGPHDAHPVAGNGNQGGLDEGLESGQPDGTQTHGIGGTGQRSRGRVDV